MVSIGLAIPLTRFPSVEPTWEFTPLSHESGAICTWEAGESGQGAIAIESHHIFHVPTLGHTYTHMLGTHACKFSRVDDAPVVFIRRNPRPGGSEIYSL
jgi:hypothetical protein